MAYTTATTSRLPGALRRIGGGILDTLIWIANIRTMIDATERLTKLSDADLQALGTTRAAEIQRIFGPRAHY